MCPRAALLAGAHYRRLDMPAVLFPHSDRGLHPDEVTIVDMLGDAGYRTACVGKWHLGHLPPCLPTDQGFDSYYGVPYSNDISPLLLGEERARSPHEAYVLLHGPGAFRSGPWKFYPLGGEGRGTERGSEAGSPLPSRSSSTTSSTTSRNGATSPRITPRSRYGWRGGNRRSDRRRQRDGGRLSSRCGTGSGARRARHRLEEGISHAKAIREKLTIL